MGLGCPPTGKTERPIPKTNPALFAEPTLACVADSTRGFMFVEWVDLRPPRTSLKTCDGVGPGEERGILCRFNVSIGPESSEKFAGAPDRGTLEGGNINAALLHVVSEGSADP